jgi:hypothetical protein
LSAAEKNYSTTEREALALVWAVQRFRGYIEETSTIAITGHQPLKWLMSLKSPSGRLARWALQLQPYQLTIEYTPGKANVVADTLSRPPPHQEEEVHVNLVSIDLPRKGPQQLRQEQLNDPELRKIISAFETENAEETSRWTCRRYLVTQGVLYRYSPEDDTEEPQLVVPTASREHIL